MQEAYLSPGQATRLHTLSSGIPLPDSDSDDEHGVKANAHADGLTRLAPVQEEDHAVSASGSEQPSANESGSGSDSDSASSISGRSGVSSVVPTEVVEDEQDAAGALGVPFSHSYSHLTHVLDSLGSNYMFVEMQPAVSGIACLG